MNCDFSPELVDYGLTKKTYIVLPDFVDYGLTKITYAFVLPDLGVPENNSFDILRKSCLQSPWNILRTSTLKVNQGRSFFMQTIALYHIKNSLVCICPSIER